jgi:hypothetical protein
MSKGLDLAGSELTLPKEIQERLLGDRSIRNWENDDVLVWFDAVFDTVSGSEKEYLTL